MWPRAGLGSVRTATKRAGGTVNNHGGSPGKRLGVKKFSGASALPPSPSFAAAAVHELTPHAVRIVSRAPSTTPSASADEYVIPGNILVRQRGSVFHPGQHVRLLFLLSPALCFVCALTPAPSVGPATQVKMGRDHTLYATVPGFVRFYKVPGARKDRKFVGIVLNKGEKLPRDETARGRSRFFGLVDLNAWHKPAPEVAASA